MTCMMRVWDRVCCRWVKWHGSRAAWQALPRAKVALAACVLCGGAAVAVLSPSARPAIYTLPPARPQGQIVFAASPPPVGGPSPAAFLPGAGPVLVDYLGPWSPAAGRETCPRPAVVEPSSLLILGSAWAVLFALRVAFRK